LVRDLTDHVVIVDDNPDMASIIAERLRFDGITNLVTFANPRTALAALRTGGRPAFVVSDFTMPGLNGLQLLEQLDQLYPGLAAVILTGDPDTALSLTHRYEILSKIDNFYPALLSHIRTVLKPVLA
jgi:DNA-binding NtrC family response regulator